MEGVKFFLWNDEYSVNIAHLDEHHKKLVEYINELYDAFMKKELDTKISSIIEKMEEYTKFHFSAEETLFRQYLYPDSAKHILEHQNFINKVAEFKKELDEKKSIVSFQVINFLRDWLMNHIKISDKKYSEYLNSKGVR